MKVIACYPRSMSAWLSNLLTVPGQSLYAHDISPFPELVETIANQPHPYKGFVDTALTVENMPECELTIIDNDPETVAEKSKKLTGDMAKEAIKTRELEMNRLKDYGKVLHMGYMDEWISDLYKEHTGLEMDCSRYHLLKNLNVQSQFAKRLMEK